MEVYVHPGDCRVERGLDDYPGQAILMDCDGEVLLVVPDTWEDHHLFTALDFANQAFRRGKDVGRNEIISGFKRLMELK